MRKSCTLSKPALICAVLVQLLCPSLSFIPAHPFSIERYQSQPRPSHSSTLRQTSLVPSDATIPVSSSSLEPCQPSGFYIHIPYCRQRCRYCDFAIVPIGNHTSNSSSHRRTAGFEQMNKRYVDALLTEIRQISPPSKAKIPLQTIYFGGGTPSLAPVESIATILQQICGNNDHAPFVLDADAEITMEMDPGTFDRAQLQSLKDLGVNRISLGVQSLNDAILEGMGRVHRRHDIARAIQDIAAVFGKDTDANYSIDLISGAPGLTLARWVDTLQQVTSGDLFAPVRPKHISIYDLQIEVGTIFDKLYGSREEDIGTMPKVVAGDKGPRLRLPSEEECAFMYKYAAGYLRAKSFEHYEVSSYAYAPDPRQQRDPSPPSWRSRHNQIYWDYNSSWCAVGLGATSFVDRNLVARPRTMSDYLEWVEESTKGTASHGGNETDDFLAELLLKRLRTSDGLDLDWLQTNYGSDATKGVLKGAQLGLELGLAIHTDANALRLKDPDGFLYSNFIISSIFSELGLEDSVS